MTERNRKQASVPAILAALLFLGVACDSPKMPTLLPTGEWQWVRQFGTEELDNVVDVAQDGLGDLYACGWVQASEKDSPHGAWLAKFTSAGEKSWRRQLMAEEAMVFDLAVDRDGDTYLVGYFPNDSGKGAFLIKYDAQGERQWRREVNSGELDDLRAVAVDNEGRCLVAEDLGA